MPRKYARKKSKKVSAKDVAMLASKFKITKEHKVQGLDNVIPFGTTVSGLTANNHWYMVDFAHIARQYARDGQSVGVNLTIDEAARESSRIYHKNSRIKFDLIPDELVLKPIQYRMVLGYFKGDDNVGSSQLTNATMSSQFPNIYTRLKRGRAGNSDFYWTYISKVHTITPKMIYDANGSDDAVGGEQMKAVWLPRHHELNMVCNQMRKYEDDEGDSLDGWRPFFALQCIPSAGNSGFSAPDLPTDTSGNRGSNPSPLLTIDCRTYFQDIN